MRDDRSALMLKHKRCNLPATYASGIGLPAKTLTRPLAQHAVTSARRARHNACMLRVMRRAARRTCRRTGVSARHRRISA
ncbi:hypothetical protein BN2475_710080 [Paraburkholderia ribeironis]|uniref:Uncharacterized protein n=1 Tax=Paraburkholderia ribeironis TaxID=1247936 RepID=A0A1N7SIA6_9BURK|nr:hypothetical protein BN2475_710080 [Paraburkholderia ribeironis]